MATPQEGAQVGALVPTFTVDDLQRSIVFYEALGFTVDERWEDNGRLLGVMMRAGKIQIGLNQDDWDGLKTRSTRACARGGACWYAGKCLHCALRLSQSDSRSAQRSSAEDQQSS